MSIAEHDIAATLQELVAEFGLTQEEHDAFVDAELNYSSSAMRSTGVARHMTSPYDIRGKVTRIPARFAGKVSSDKQMMIRRLYPDFEVTFAQEKVQSHAVAACMRMLDRMLLKKRAPTGQKLLSVGGNYEYELTNSDVVVHCCTPEHTLVRDAKEAAREVQRMSRIRAMAAGKGCNDVVARRATAFLTDTESQWRCKKLAQECDYPAGVIMMSHVYDMTLEQIVKTMISHDAQLVLGCILFTNDMLVSNSGRLPHSDGYYEIKKRKISYGFQRESQWEYTHNWTELRRFAFGGTVVEVGSRRAFYSITEMRGDTLFFTMTLAPVPAVAKPVVKKWKNDEGKRAIVHGYKLSETDRTSEERALVAEEFSYPYDPFVKSLAYATERMEKGSFTLEDLQRKVRAVFADTTINSVKVAGFARLDDEQMAYFLTNVGVLAAITVQTSTSDEGVMVAGVKIRRGALQQGIFPKIKQAFVKFATQPFPNNSAVFQFLKRLSNAFKYSDDRIISRLSWEVDDGYRAASISPTFTLLGRTGGSNQAADFTSAEMSRDEQLAVVMSAADDSEEFAVILAEAAASVFPEPGLEMWLTGLRARHNVAVNEAARAAERAARDRAQDPDVNLREPSEPGDVEVQDLDDAPDDDDTPDAMQAPDVAPDIARGEALRAKALEMGVSLDPTDELSYEAQPVAECEAVANTAITEAIYLIEAEEEKVLGESRKNFEQVSSNGLPDMNKLRNHARLNFEPDFWNVRGGRIHGDSWLHKRVRETEKYFPFSAVYCPYADAIIRVTTKLVSAAEGTYEHTVFAHDGVPVTGVVMTTTQLVIYNGPVIISNMRNALRIPLHSHFTMSFVEGVPGCGKTHYIIHSAKPTDSVIACGRENAETTRARIVAHSDGLPEAERFKQPSRGVRTLDSALMYPTADRHGTVFLDECFQDHAGKFWAVIKLWRAKTVQALGDRKQIPYIDRNYTNRCLMPRLSKWSLRVGKYVTRRCPRDATMAIARFYGWKIRTTSAITGSMSLELNTVIVPNLPGWKYLTMYQDDKHNLLRRGYRDVNTVAEVQGQTYPKVALVRIQEREMPLFNAEEQVDVALSRHTEQFVYYAPDDRNDLLTKLVREALGNLALVDKYGDTASASVPIFDI